MLTGQIRSIASAIKNKITLNYAPCYEVSCIANAKALNNDVCQDIEIDSTTLVGKSTIKHKKFTTIEAMNDAIESLKTGIVA